MKKIAIAGLLLSAAGSAAAAGAALAEGNNAISTTACPLLQDAVTVTLSKANVGYYDCNTTTATIGVAVANSSGKNKVFSLGSSGGQLTETTLSSAPTTTNAKTAAESKSASS